MPERLSEPQKQTGNKYKTLLSNTLLISIGTFGSKLLVFLMVRFYTNYLSPAEYGTADLVMQTGDLLVPLISLGITDAVFRFAIDQPERRKAIFSIGCYTIFCGAGMFLFILPALRLIDGLSGYLLLIVVFTVFACYHSLCSQFVRATGDTALFALQGLLNTSLVIGFNLLFLAVFHLGILGYVLSVSVADLICTVFLVIKRKLWRQLIFSPSKNILRKMLHYSIPLIPTTVFWWITSVSDRYMVTGFINSDANGIYSVAYKIPTMITLMSNMFLEAWKFSSVYEAKGGREEHIQFFSEVWSAFQSVMILVGAVLVAFSKVVIQILSAKSYYSAWQYVPVLCAAMVFASFSTFLSSVYLVTKRSDLSFWTSLLGASVNVILNLVLIPSPLGIQGAAIATMVCYIVVFLVRAISSRKLIPFKLHLFRLFINACILAVQIVIMLREPPMWVLMQAACILVLAVLNLRPLLETFKRIISLFFSRGKRS